MSVVVIEQGSASTFRENINANFSAIETDISNLNSALALKASTTHASTHAINGSDLLISNVIGLDSSIRSTLNLAEGASISDALYALSQKVTPAEVHVIGDVGTTVTMTKSGKTLTATVAANGYAVLYPTNLGDWTVSFTSEGTVKSTIFTVDVIGILYCYPFAYGGSLEATAWGEIGIASNLGLASQSFAIGDKKSVTLNGETYYAQIIGFDHDTLTTASGSRTKAGITFQLENCFATAYYMNSTNSNTTGWTSSYMRGTVMPLMKGYMPTALTNVLKKVNKLTSAGNKSSTINTTSDDLFLLSEIEVFGTNAFSKAGEGSQYGYYSAGNSKIKKVNGSANVWCERSPYHGNEFSFCYVKSDGDVGAADANQAHGVAFGFCI